MKKKVDFKFGLIAVFVVLGFFYVLMFVKPEITGRVVVEEQYNYTQLINKSFNESSEYVWQLENPGNLRSVKLNGFISNAGSAKVYLRNDNNSYLTFDSSEPGIKSRITGLVVLNNSNETINETDTNVTEINETLYETEINVTDNVTKKINITANITEINITDVNITEPLALNISEPNVTENITEKIDVTEEISITINITKNITEKIIEFISFEDICIETCLLYNLNESSYALVIEVENAILNITKIDYSIAEFEVIEEAIIVPSIKIEDKEGTEIAFATLVNRSDGKFDLNLKPKKKVYSIAAAEKWEIDIKGLAEPNITAKIDDIADKKIKTEVFAVEPVEIEEAEITLAKKEEVNVILKCSDFDIESFSCLAWSETNIPFTDNGDTITFTVNEFSGYGGGYKAMQAGGCDYNLSTCNTSGWVANKIYCLTTDLLNVSGDCMSIDADNVTLDCQGHTIIGDTTTGTEGIQAWYAGNVTVHNCTIKNFYTGIRFWDTNGGIASNNVIENSSGNGISVSASRNVALMHNLINKSNYAGVNIGGTNAVNNTLFSNIIINSKLGSGLQMQFAHFANITNNTIENCLNGILAGSTNWTSVNDNIIKNNTQHGIHYGANAYHNNFTGNEIMYSNWSGIYLQYNLNTRYNFFFDNLACFNNQSGGAYYDVYDGDANSFANTRCDLSYGMTCNYTCSANYSNYDGSTTDFANVPDIENVENCTLENTTNGKVVWKGIVNALGADFDDNVQIEDRFIAINASALHSSFNSSANLSLYNVDCNGSIVYYNPGFGFSSVSELIAGGAVCDETTDPNCTNVNCTSNTLNFTVSHFSGFGQGFGVPGVENITLNSTYGTNLTTENLTVYYDLVNANISIIDWKKNNKSIMVLNMPFEGGSNSTFTKDYSEFSNNGTVINAIWNSTGGYDGRGAYEFDSVDDYIDLGNDASLQSSFPVSVSAWVNVPVTDISNPIFDSDYVDNLYTGYWMDITNTGQVVLHFGDGESPGSSNRQTKLSADSINANEWTHIVGVIRGASDMDIYINGVDAGGSYSGNGGNIVYSSGPAVIGKNDASSVNPPYYFNGTVDEVLVFNRSLSADQIKALYENRTDLIVSQETSVGDVWQACITPNDGTQDGATNCSNNLTVLAPPGIAPVINWINATPSPQGYGENATINANITHANGQDNISAVWVGVTPPGGTETNYTMINISSEIWEYDYISFTNGTHQYTVYTNSTEGDTSASSETFNIYSIVLSGIRVNKNNNYTRYNHTYFGYVSGENVLLTEVPAENITNLQFSIGINATTTNETLQGALSKYVDLVWIIDDTGSMGPHINVVKNNIDSFLNNLSSAGLTYSNALYTYKDGPPVWKGQTGDLNAFKDMISAIGVSGGGDIPENPYYAMHLAMNFSTTPIIYHLNSKKYVILVTDAGAHTPSNPGNAGPFAKYYESDIKNLAVKNSFEVIVSVDPSDLSYYDSIATGTLGELFDLGGLDFAMTSLANIIITEVAGFTIKTAPYNGSTVFNEFTNQTNMTIKELVEYDINNNPNSTIPSDLYTNPQFNITNYAIVIDSAFSENNSNVIDFIDKKFANSSDGDEISPYNLSYVENSTVYLRYPTAGSMSFMFNNASLNTSIYTLLGVQYFNETSGSWQNISTIVNDTSSRRINPQSYLTLYELWNSNPFNVRYYPDGTYRAVAYATDPNDNILTNLNGSPISAYSQNFTVVTETLNCTHWVIETYTLLDEPRMCTVITVQNSSMLNLTGSASLIASEIYVQNNSVITGSRINITAEKLVIESGSSINATAKGYPGGTFGGSAATSGGDGPGGGAGYWAGAGHGGKGGDANNGVYKGGQPYGSSLYPTTPGSGGGGGTTTSYNGGAGGGAIKIETETLILNGTITANGGNGITAGGGGAGGSVLIITNNLTGTGTVSANGGSGAGTNAGGGSGGRIAIHYNYSTFDTSHASAAKGTKGSTGGADGEAGTLIFIDVDDNAAIIKDGFRFQELCSPLWEHNQTPCEYKNTSFYKTDNPSLWNFTNLTIINADNVATNITYLNIAADTLNITSTTLTGTAHELVIEASTFTPLISSAINHKQINITAPDLTLSSSSIYGNMHVRTTNTILDSNSQFNANSKGYPGGTFGGSAATSGGDGPGGGAGYWAGAGHGGKGGDANNGVYKGGQPYGSSLYPTTPGSGGGGGTTTSYNGGAGGGAIKIEANAFTLDGAISANGGNAVTAGGGGASGSVLIITNNLTGTGTVSANGGSGAGTNAGGGSGGRIAIHYNYSTFDTSHASAAKGTKGGASGEDGKTGTLIFIDVDDNAAIIKDGFRFQGLTGRNNETQNTTFFKTDNINLWNFTNLTVTDATLTSEINPLILNVSDTLNLTNAGLPNVTLALEYGSLVGGNTNIPSSGGKLKLDRRNIGEITWIPTLGAVSGVIENVEIGDGYVRVNSDAEPDLDRPANITLEGITASEPTIYIDSDDNYAYQLCPSSICTMIDDIVPVIKFNVTGFTGYAVSENTSLTIDNNGPKPVGQSVIFNATYVNGSLGNLITGATCNITFNDSSVLMTELANRYEYSRSFSIPGNYSYNVTCNKTGFPTLEAEDYANITEAAVPADCDYYLYSCKTSNWEPNKVYCLNQSIVNNSLTEACMKITAQNVTLDCLGHYILSSNSAAGVYTGQTGTIIRNCNISMGITPGFGIVLNNANNSQVINGIFENQSVGIYCNSSSNILIKDNAIKDNTMYGIWFEGCSNNTETELAGSGAAGDPYRITNCTGLQNIKNDLIAYYILGNDIDCGVAPYNTGPGFEPIGNSTNPFGGNLDGNLKRIANLYINRPSSDYIGLFGYANSSAAISKAALVNANINGRDYVGALAGRSDGSISNSYSTGSINGTNYIGGLAGYNNETIVNSYSTADVNGNDSVGGLAGYSYNISNSYAAGDASGNSNTGGLVGNNSGNITYSFWYNHSGNPDNCTGNQGNPAGCTARDDETDFYYGAPPADVWDLDNVWEAISSHPVFKTAQSIKFAPAGFGIIDNTIRNNSYGIYFESSSLNQIVSNEISQSSTYGIQLDSASDDNLFYNNIISNNASNVNDTGTDNYWNTTYSCSSGLNIFNRNCIGGNYWDDYNGSDHGNGTLPGIPNIADDGIGDTYVPHNQDYLPLVNFANIKIEIVIPANDTEYFICNELNEFTVNVSCTSIAPCGEIKVALDPEPIENSSDENSEGDFSFSGNYKIASADFNVSNPPPGTSFADENGNIIANTSGIAYLRKNDINFVRLELTGNIDLSGAAADTDGKKSLLHFGAASRSNISTATLIMEKGISNFARVCPDAVSLSQVAGGCTNEIILAPNNPVQGGYNLTNLIEPDYWHVAADAAVFSTGAESGSKGGIVPYGSGSPFWTNTTNPYTIYLGSRESQAVTFWVNASCGNVGATYEFFANASSAVFNISDKTGTVNIIITKPECEIKYLGKRFFNISENPALIRNCTELQDMENNLSGNYILLNDINCSDTINWNSGQGFEPIGNNTNQFTGIFDGNNHFITGLYIDNIDEYVGLFGYISSSAVVKNVGLKDVTIILDDAPNSFNDAGGLVGYSAGLIENCYTTGIINASVNSTSPGVGYLVGGLVGVNDGNISNSYSTAAVIGDDEIGGLAGANRPSANIINSYAAGNVTENNISRNGNYTGGLVGYDYGGTIENCYFTGRIDAGSTSGVGGLVGNNDGNINNSYWNNRTDNLNASVCVGSGPGSVNCTVIQNNEAYFYDSSNAPMTSWDFINVWQEDTNDYPELKWLKFTETYFPDVWHNMTYNDSYFDLVDRRYSLISEYNRTFPIYGIYDQTAICSAFGFYAVQEYDNITISPEVEFRLGVHDWCRNEIDDDNDTKPPMHALWSSCVDNKLNDAASASDISNLNFTDCWARYQACGPCPDVENYTYDSCADGINNDYDNGTGGYLFDNVSGIDCADTDCIGELASYKGTRCVADGQESTAPLCTDSADNDGDGDIDSADSDCPAITPDPYVNETTASFKLDRAFYDPSITTLDTGDFSFTSIKNYTSQKNCRLSVYNANKDLYYVRETFNGVVNGNNITCRLPDFDITQLPKYSEGEIADGAYFLQMSINHTDGYIFNSSYKIFYICNDLSSSGTTPDGLKWTCAKADLDNDGWTEGLYTTLYNPLNNTNLTCDTCLGVVNTGQDSDGDGIDDACDVFENLTIRFPEGIYEPLCCSGGGTSCDDNPYSTEDINCLTGDVLRGSHLHTFSIAFENATAAAGPHSCDIVRSDGSVLQLQGTHSTITEGTISLEYTIPNATESIINRSAPWRIKSCEINYGVTYVNNSINQPLYVHLNNWTGVGEGLDTSRAVGCYGSQALTYFNNTVKCGWSGDVIFALHMSDKTTKEVLCHDGQDNDNDGDIDCDDSDCMGISYFTCPSAAGYFTVHPFLTGYSSLSGPYGTQSATCSADTNICTGSFSAGAKTINYKYTLNVQPSGTLKVKFDLGSSSGFASNMINDIPSFSTYDKYVYASGATTLPADVIGAGSVSYQTKGTISGTLKQVMYVNYNSASPATDNFELVAEYGGVPAQETGLSFTITSAAPSNWDENHSALPHVRTSFIKGPYNQPSISSSRHSCNDREDNDLDFENRNDCRDLDCDNEIIGVTAGNDLIRCEYGAETTCWDGYDNDHDNLVDCADPDCNNSIGAYYVGDTPVKYFTGSAEVAMCEYGSTAEGTINYTSSPSSCNDTFNNDADAGNQWDNYACDPTDPDECYNKATDCYDRFSCWGRSGTNTGICPLRENRTDWCQDSIDNDYDDRPISPAAFNNWLGIYNPRAGSAAQNRTDCMDYDCYAVTDAGDYLCSALPDNITEFNGSLDGGLTCFDSLDNDLDWYYWTGSNYAENSSSGYDCQDPDCAGVINPLAPSKQCLEQELKLGFYDFCRIEGDDDFDSLPTSLYSGSSCVDNRLNDTDTATSISNLNGTDCWAIYQVCGPCPSIENYTWEACADSADNDYDNGAGTYDGFGSGGINCEDSDCLNELGSYGGAICTSSENTNLLCSDEFNNDASGGIDCADSNCAGKTGSDGQTCEPSGETSCSDSFDNDRDSYRDCADFSCNGISGCINSSNGAEWSHASCITVPLTASGSAGTANYQHLSRLYVGQNYIVRVSKTSSSNNPVISIAENDPATGKRFPYNTSLCTLDDGGAGFIWLPEPEGYSGIIQYTGTLNSFDLTLTCTTPATPQASQSYVLKYTETGEISPVTLSTQLYENMPPAVSKIQVGGNISSDVIIKYGESLTFKAKPSNDPSGICGCTFELDGTSYSKTDSFCRQTSAPIYRDIPNYIPKASAEDGAANTGSQFTASGINVKVLPIDTTPNYRLDRPFYNATNYTILDTGTFSFITGQDDTFASCNIHILNGSKSILQTLTADVNNPSAYEIECSLDNLNLSNYINLSQDGIYFIYANTTDSDNDAVNSSYKIFYVCNDLNSSGATPDGLKWTCAKADLDNDGWTEGLYTTLYTNPPVNGPVQPCDSCPPPIVNTGLDSDGDGIDDACDEQKNLTIWDDTDSQTKFPNDNVNFYANYTDEFENTITDAVCAIFFPFDNLNASMAFNNITQLYIYSRTFGSPGAYYWNVTCAVEGRFNTANDTAVISSAAAPAAAPRVPAIGARRLTVCAEDWNCSEWRPCLPDGIQYRECYDLNNCDELYNKRVVLHINRSEKPEEARSCTYEPKCYDQIFNGNESDIDCGGLLCPKCADGKRCRADEDCINLCNQTSKICYSPVRLPIRIRPPLALIIAMLLLVLLVLEAAIYRYQREWMHGRIEHYKSRRAVARRERTIRRKREEEIRRARESEKRREELRRLREEEAERRTETARRAAETRKARLEERRKSALKALEKARARREELRRLREAEAERRREAARRAAETRKARLGEERKTRFRSAIESIESRIARLKEERESRLKEIERRRKAAEKRAAKLAEERELYKASREEYTKTLNAFLNNAINQGYNKGQIRQLLASKGWPKKLVAEYCDEFFEKNQELISEIRREERIARGEPRQLIKEIRKKEEAAKKRLKELEKRLLEIDRQMAGK
jgi:hypothetical protein